MKPPRFFRYQAPVEAAPEPPESETVRVAQAREVYEQRVRAAHAATAARQERAATQPTHSQMATGSAFTSSIPWTAASHHRTIEGDVVEMYDANGNVERHVFRPR